MIKKDLLKKKYDDFLMKYGKNYDKDTLDFIKENFWTYRNSSEAPCVLRQLYSAFESIPEDQDVYRAHLKRIKNNFGLSRNILEISCGFYPALGRLVAQEQIKLGKGTITLYDPELVLEQTKYQNMVLHKETFNSTMSVREFDLITGTYPCNATELIIQKACENQKDFYLAMCGCTHFDYYDLMYYGGNPEIYQEYIIDKTERLLKKHENGELVIERLEDHYGLEYPILYNKK